jgi:hypothetical protein
MRRLVPTDVIGAIDQWFPWARNWSMAVQSNARTQARFVGVSRLPGLVEMMDQVPDELLTLESAEAGAFLMAKAALRHEAQLLASGARKDAVEWPILGERDCVEIVRTALSKCRDEALSASGVELKFLKDSDLETTLRIDLGSVERALSNSEWKAATVISGSVIEALLLWAVDQCPLPDVSTAIQSAINANKLSKAPKPKHDRWELHELIEIAHELKQIGDDTLSSVRPSRNFRNAIHLGRVQRTGIQCDRGMAHTAYGAVFNVIRELAANYP